MVYRNRELWNPEKVEGMGIQNCFIPFGKKPFVL